MHLETKDCLATTSQQVNNNPEHLRIVAAGFAQASYTRI